ncbi:MAG: hypothetical protein EZS28_015113 [Streblomastix strix]|uniref:Uncharacterized protein n=1 Tax=Streblomastix strix TaxID=222440 RepID=A0A5J4W3S2_9EUKA|nr:MAG: hypothetical protein EZS28_015113 [Streblomastix strix]
MSDQEEALRHEEEILKSEEEVANQEMSDEAIARALQDELDAEGQQTQVFAVHQKKNKNKNKNKKVTVINLNFVKPIQPLKETPVKEQVQSASDEIIEQHQKKQSLIQITEQPIKVQQQKQQIIPMIDSKEVQEEYNSIEKEDNNDINSPSEQQDYQQTSHHIQIQREHQQQSLAQLELNREQYHGKVRVTFILNQNQRQQKVKMFPQRTTKKQLIQSAQQAFNKRKNFFKRIFLRDGKELPNNEDEFNIFADDQFLFSAGEEYIGISGNKPIITNDDNKQEEEQTKEEQNNQSEQKEDNQHENMIHKQE